MTESPGRTLYVVTGPTAVGKTAFAIRLAKELGAEIISADSRQFYREMNIGTAKPSEEELAMVPHHFIGHVSVHQLYSAGDFEKDALQKIAGLHREHDAVVMVGGSGLYIKAVCEGLDDMPGADPQLRKELQMQFESGGIERLRERLRLLRPQALGSIDPDNPQRLMRAIEIALQEGEGYVARPKAGARNFLIRKIGLELPREELYARINSRTDEMMRAGLLEEAQGLFHLRHLNALQTVGYTELFEHTAGKHSLETAVALIKQHTRNYAKRQMTWFRKDKEIRWVHA